jgi:hypothetical protein
LSEEDKLDDTYNIGIQIAQVKTHFIKYNMDDVFVIVKPIQSTTNPTDWSQLDPLNFIDLFTNYSMIQEAQVAARNK